MSTPDWVVEPKPVLDAEQAAAERAIGISRAARAAKAAFKADAWDAVYARALEHAGGGQFSCDDVWDLLPGRPREARALGGVMIEAAAKGWIVNIGTTPSKQKQNHGRHVTLWRSLL